MKWGRALAQLRSAEAALAVAQGADDELFDRVLGRFNRALARLLGAPAPHAAALGVKLDLLVAHQVWELVFAEASLVALRRDARRLARLDRGADAMIAPGLRPCRRASRGVSSRP